MATIGRAAAVAQLGPAHVSGLATWLIWLAVHIVMLIGFGNRLLVLLQWAWWYFSYERGARLITRPWSSAATPVGVGPPADQTRPSNVASASAA
jgi:NADH:ubiquinone reductase (H+-translocating)